jgi:hypothetical protein
MNKRVPRKRKPVAPPVNQHVEGFPEDPAVTVLEKVLDRLSKQAIKHDDLANADAAIIQCFFASLNYDTRKDPINPIGPSKIVLSTAQRAQLKWNLRLAFNYPEDKRLVVCGDGFANLGLGVRENKAEATERSEVAGALWCGAQVDRGMDFHPPYLFRFSALQDLAVKRGAYPISQ